MKKLFNSHYLDSVDVEEVEIQVIPKPRVEKVCLKLNLATARILDEYLKGPVWPHPNGGVHLNSIHVNLQAALKEIDRMGAE